MARKPEAPAPTREEIRAARAAERMAARIREAARLAEEYERTLDPRERGEKRSNL